MPILRTRTLCLLFAPALLILAAVWWLHARSSPSPMAASRALTVTNPVSPSTRPDPSLASGSDRSQSAPVASGHAGLDGQSDLYRYALSLSDSASGGDAEARWLLSRVYDYCAGYAFDPAGYRADSDGMARERDLAALVSARARLAARCGGFSDHDDLSAARATALRTQAARAGSIAAEAALLAAGQPLQDSTKYKRDLVERVLASRDPEAYLALSSAMGSRASGDDAYQDYVAGDQSAELAWQVAACRLGLDCAADSTLVTSYCANAGICSQNSSQDFESFVFDAAVPRQGASKMDQMIVALTEGGGA